MNLAVSQLAGMESYCDYTEQFTGGEAEAEDMDGVYWATGKGLLAVPGHEDLVAQRMRLHADRQDQSALRAEWQGYCRALANDEWGDASPSRMMVELWRELSGDAPRQWDTKGYNALHV